VTRAGTARDAIVGPDNGSDDTRGDGTRRYPIHHTIRSPRVAKGVYLTGPSASTTSVDSARQASQYDDSFRRKSTDTGNAVQSSDMWNVVPETTEDEGLRLLAHHIVGYTETIGELLRAEEFRLAACDRGSDLCQ
jgi:hypothetical protein